MTTPLKIGISTLLLTFAELSQAQIIGQTIGQVNYGGTGCPAETIEAVVDQAENTISLQLLDLQTFVGDATAKTIDRKACAIAVPIKVPEGMMIGSIQALYLGAAVVSEVGTIQLNSEHFLAGGRGKVNKITLGTTEAASFGISQKATIASDCGADVSFRANFSMLAKTDSGSDDLTAGILDQVQYKVNFVTCPN